MSCEELKMNYAEIEALQKLPMSELVKQATPTPIPVVKLDHTVTANLMKSLKEQQRG